MPDLFWYAVLAAGLASVFYLSISSAFPIILAMAAIVILVKRDSVKEKT